MTTLIKAIPALLVAALGAVFAWMWLILMPTAPFVPILIGAGIAVVGFALRALGRGRVRSAPEAGLPLLEAWALTILAVGSLVAGFVIVVAVWLAGQTPTGTPETTKQVITAVVTGFTAFLSASFIKGFEDFDALIATSVKTDLQAAFASCTYPAESAGWKALNANYAPGATGWGFNARRARAKILATTPCP